MYKILKASEIFRDLIVFIKHFFGLFRQNILISTLFSTNDDDDTLRKEIFVGRKFRQIRFLYRPPSPPKKKCRFQKINGLQVNVVQQVY